MISVEQRDSERLFGERLAVPDRIVALDRLTSPPFRADGGDR